MNNFTFSLVTEEAEFEPLLLQSNSHFTQSFFYGEWQKGVGEKVRAFTCRKEAETVACFQIIRYDLPLGRSYLYIPHGPVLKNLSQSETEDFAVEFRKFLETEAKREKAIFVRFDPFPNSQEVNGVFKKSFGAASAFSYHSAHFQPKFEWELDLTKPEQELLSGMHEKTRYNIGLSARKGITVEIVTDELGNYFDPFYSLTEETARRDGFGLHSKDYYRNIFNRGEGKIVLAVARNGEKILVTNLLLKYGKELYYVYGASSNEERNLMPTFLAQWGAIKWAKENGFETYNFGGYNPEDSSLYPSYSGISKFKRNFGGRLKEFSPFYDLVTEPIFYWAYIIRRRFV